MNLRFMRSKIFYCVCCVFFSINLSAQAVKIYDTKADPDKQLEEAIRTAQKTGKHIFLQIGGNWCPWCVKFHHFLSKDKELKDMVAKHYVMLHINYDRKVKKNQDFFAGLAYPQRFGFPVFVILNASGKLLHTQNSWYLEKGTDYDKSKVAAFLKNWTAKALSPESYK